MKRLILAACLSMSCCQASTKLLVTVVEQKTGVPLTGLKAGDFTVADDNGARRVESAEYSSSPMDVMLLLDTSLLGAVVQPLAESLVGQLRPKEQMAVVAFHSAADLIQDFTSSQELLRRAIETVKYGNPPRVADALYAAVDGGFQASVFRRVIVLVTAGVEGPSRVGEREVLKLARRNSVSIYPVFVLGREKPMFERLARQTGGVCFELKDKQRVPDAKTAGRVFEVLRSNYTLTVEGNMALGDRIRIDVKRPERLFVSGLPLD